MKNLKKRKICVITGTRAEYGLLKLVMEKIHQSQNLSLQVIATGMHLMKKYGLTIEKIIEDGFRVNAQVPLKNVDADQWALASSIGNSIIDITKELKKLNPDIVLILGDRFETLSAAIAASYSSKVLAHISGGDTLGGGFDEYTRHAITKIAHLHFPSTKKNAERIIKMGERPNYVFQVGSTTVETVLDKKLPSKKDIKQKYNINLQKPLFLVIQHPVSTSPETAGKEMRVTLTAIQPFNVPAIIIYPNNDPGSKKIINEIKKFCFSYPDIFTSYKNLPFEDYLSIMKIAHVMIGNSSSGIIESPIFRLPVVNVGPREKARERSSNVIDTDYNYKNIKVAIEKALYDTNFLQKIKHCKNPYGNGRASEKIVKVLSKLKINKELFQKQLTY